jgi:hypothetical protein
MDFGSDRSRGTTERFLSDQSSLPVMDVPMTAHLSAKNFWAKALPMPRDTPVMSEVFIAFIISTSEDLWKLACIRSERKEKPLI